MARGLLCRILDYMLEQGWIQRGSVILDTFGGVSTTAIEGASRGLKVVTVELEERFHRLGLESVALHKRAWQAFGDPQPLILQGDSRHLCEVLRGAGVASGIVGSPPWAAQMNEGGNTPAAQGIGRSGRDQRPCEANGEHNPTRGYGDTPGQLAQMPAGQPPEVGQADCVGAIVGSPPFVQSTGGKDSGIYGAQKGTNDYKEQRSAGGTLGLGASYMAGDQGDTAGQLGSMKEGQPPQVGQADCVVGSPPYSEGLGHGGTPTKNPTHSPESGKHFVLQAMENGYGTTEGQLGAMVPGTPPDEAGAEVDALVGSPPWEGTGQSDHTRAEYEALNAQLAADGNGHGGKPGASVGNDYGTSPGQLGNEQGDTFWEAAKQILTQCEMVLKPGGVCAWVCKDFIRSGQRVPFAQQWATLCAACGLEPFLWVQASLVKEERHPSLFGGDEVKKTERKSFFRRLSERRGSPKIDHEDVIFCRKKE